MHTLAQLDPIVPFECDFVYPEFHTGELLGPETGDPATFDTFEDLWAAFHAQMAAGVQRAVETANAGEIDVSVYRVDGSFVRRISGGTISGNEFSVRWDGRDDRGNAAPSGVYFYAVRSAGFSAAGKMLLAR